MSIITFYHIEKSAGSSFRKLLLNYILHKYNIKGPQVYHIENDLEFLNNHIYLLDKYKFILHHVSYSNYLFNNTKFNITILRKPVERVISHFHYFDSETLKYKNLLEYKNADFNGFKNYCLFTGNLQCLKFSGEFIQILNTEKDYKSYFTKILNSNLIKNVMHNLLQFNAVLIFEKLNLHKLNEVFNDYEYDFINNFTHENINKSKNYNYNEDFIKELNEYCLYDNIVYEYFYQIENMYCSVLNNVIETHVEEKTLINNEELNI